MHRRLPGVCGWVLILAGLFATGSAEAYFQDVAVGARPSGMGDAFVGVADDTHALLFNPAGLIRLSEWELSAMYADLYAGLDLTLYDGRKDYSGYHFIGLGLPGESGADAWGGAWSRLYSALYSEDTIMISYAHRVWAPWGLDLGVTLKGLQWSLALNDTTANASVYPARSKTAMTYDFGILISPFDGWSAGIAGENLWPADVGLTTAEYVPSIWRGGASYHWRVNQWSLDSLLASLEMEWRDARTTPKFGLESWWFRHSVALRGGVNSEAASAGLGVRYPLGTLNMNLQLDYAFTYPFLVMDTWGSHRLELTLGWTPPRPPLKALPPMPTPEPSRQTPVEALGTTLLPESLGRTTTVAFTPTVPLSQGLESENAGLTQRPTWPIGNTKETIVIGYDANVLMEYANLPETLRHLDQLEKSILARTGVGVERILVNGANELLAALQQGDVDMVLFSDTVYKNSQRQNLADSVLVPLINGKDTQRLCLVVRDDNTLNALAPLSNTRLGYISWDSLRQLRTQFPLGSVEFQEQHQLRRSKDAIVALQLHEVDVVLAQERILKVFDDMKIVQPQPVGIKALAYSRPFSNAPVLFRKYLAAGKAPKLQKIKNVLLSLYLDAETKKVLRFFDIDRLIAAQ